MENNNNGAAPHDTKNETKNEFDQLEISIEQKLDKLDLLSDSCCIYRVPERLRCPYPNIYTPKVVSIGPLHHGKESLRDMEEHKYRYLKQFLDRTQLDLQFYIEEVRSEEAKLRSFYAESIRFSSDEFVNIILVDSAFIIQLFLNAYFNIAPAGDRMIRSPWMISDIRTDLLLLENQVPFFILKNLYYLNPETNPDDEDRILSFIQLFRHIFCNILNDIGVVYDFKTVSSCQVEGEHFIDIVRNLCLPSKPLDAPLNAAKHFIDIVRNLCLPSKPLDAAEPREMTAPSITELHRAGVKLKVSPTRNLFNIQFNNGILEIPKLTFHEELEPTLRNLAAFEQCHYNDSNPIASYLILLDSFVNTQKDMELLVKFKIVTNNLGDSSEACSLINSLCKGITVNPCFYFATLCEDLHKHCNWPWNHWKASLRQNYLNSPWQIASVVAALLLIILTITQTICSVISLL